MVVLSLFDGISCGQVALEKAGIVVDKYYAYEIDKYAIAITQKNYPDTIQCGDVTSADFSKYKGKVDLLLGGSPCQSLSITQSKNRQHLEGKSRLFFDYVRALREVEPRWFLFENVASMSKESKRIITEYLGVEPVLINSNAFLAQDRPRLYWANITVSSKELKPCGLVLRDILEPIVDESYFYNQRVFNVDMSKQVCATLDIKGHDIIRRVHSPAFKCHTLTVCTGGNKQKKVLIDGRARKLTPLEYERLQGLPDNYTADVVAKSHRYNGIGNGWSVDVIVYILSFLKLRS